VHTITLRHFLYASIVIAIILSPIISHYEINRSSAAFTRFERLEITYVAADQNSRKIYCKLMNTGSMSLTLIEVLVNDRVVTTGDLLPLPMYPGDGYTYSFRYDGPWEGFIEIAFHTRESKVYTLRVDILEASKNSIAQAFINSMSRTELILKNINGLLQGVYFESPSAMNLISQARTLLTGAQDAYNRGDYESAYTIAASALSLITQAMWVEKSYQAEKMRMLVASGAGLGVVTIVISLLLIRKRIHKTHEPLLSIIGLIGLLLFLLALFIIG